MNAIKTSEFTLVDGAIVQASTSTGALSAAVLGNALWLRRTPAGHIASAFHGGHAIGFELASSTIPTAIIATAYAAADPEGAAKAQAAYDEFLAEYRAEKAERLARARMGSTMIDLGKALRRFVEGASGQ